MTKKVKETSDLHYHSSEQLTPKEKEPKRDFWLLLGQKSFQKTWDNKFDKRWDDVL